MAHMRQSRPDSDLGCLVKVLEPSSDGAHIRQSRPDSGLARSCLKTVGLEALPGAIRLCGGITHFFDLDFRMCDKFARQRFRPRGSG